jgi:hypothetical protein
MFNASEVDVGVGDVTCAEKNRTGTTKLMVLSPVAVADF